MFIWVEMQEKISSEPPGLIDVVVTDVYARGDIFASKVHNSSGHSGLSRNFGALEMPPFLHFFYFTEL